MGHYTTDVRTRRLGLPATALPVHDNAYLTTLPPWRPLAAAGTIGGRVQYPEIKMPRRGNMTPSARLSVIQILTPQPVEERFSVLHHRGRPRSEHTLLNECVGSFNVDPGNSLRASL